MALKGSPDGLSYSQLHYEVARTNKTRELLVLLEKEGLIIRKEKLHFITSDGLSILNMVESIISLPQNGEGTL